jgi:hypothetical protein
MERDALDRARQNRARQKKKEWREEEDRRLKTGKRRRNEPQFSNRPRLSPTEKEQATSSLRPATLVDFLFRLRIGSQYDDAGVFSEGPVDSTQAWMFIRNLRIVTSAVLTASEFVVRSFGGPNLFDPIVADWLGRQQMTPGQGTLAARAPRLSSKP